MNYATKINVSTMGVIFAISGIFHGFFEILQGDKPTNSIFIHAIGEEHKMWLYGNEPAITLIQNYLLTGVLTIIASALIIIWSIFYVQRKNGPTIYLILFIILFLVGGGIGQVIFFSLTWLVAIQINRPLKFPKRFLTNSATVFLTKLWFPSLLVSAFLILIALEIAVFGIVPGIRNPDQISIFMLVFLGSCLCLLILAFISGFAFDLEKRKSI